MERAKVALADPCHNAELMALAQEIEDGKPYRKPTPEEHTMIVKQFVEEGLAIDRGFKAKLPATAATHGGRNEKR